MFVFKLEIIARITYRYYCAFVVSFFAIIQHKREEIRVKLVPKINSTQLSEKKFPIVFNAKKNTKNQIMTLINLLETLLLMFLAVY